MTAGSMQIKEMRYVGGSRFSALQTYVGWQLKYALLLAQSCML